MVAINDAMAGKTMGQGDVDTGQGKGQRKGGDKSNRQHYSSVGKSPQD